MVHQIMSKRRNLLVGAVIAAGAGVVGIPADFRTGCHLRIVMDKVMPQSRNLLVGTVITAGTGIVGFPAHFCAGSCLCVMVHQIMAQSRDDHRCFDLGLPLAIAEQFATTVALAGPISLRAGFGTGGLHPGRLFQVVAKGLDDHGFCDLIFALGVAEQLAAAVALAGPVGLRAGRCAGGLHPGRLFQVMAQGFVVFHAAHFTDRPAGAGGCAAGMDLCFFPSATVTFPGMGIVPIGMPGIEMMAFHVE